MLIPRLAIASVALNRLPGLSGSVTERSFVAAFWFFIRFPFRVSSWSLSAVGPLLPPDHARSRPMCKAQGATFVTIPTTARTLDARSAFRDDLARVAIHQRQSHRCDAPEIGVVRLRRPPREQQGDED